MPDATSLFDSFEAPLATITADTATSGQSYIVITIISFAARRIHSTSIATVEYFAPLEAINQYKYFAHFSSQ